MTAYSSPSDDSHAGTPAMPGGRALVNRTRAIVVHASLVVVALAILAKAVKLQLVDSRFWANAAVEQQVRERSVTPPRGAILDASGNVLVESRELMQVTFSPNNIKPFRKRGAKRGSPPLSGRRVVRDGLKSLGVHDTIIRRVMDSTRKWVELPKLYAPREVERFAGVPGVTLKRLLKRTVSAPLGIAGILGTVRDENTPIGGIELELDAVLRGVDGRSARLRDGRGGELETPALAGLDARPGHTVSLTIIKSLQEIAERGLMNGVSETGASGGDVVIMDPRDGAVLALAGVRNRKPSFTVTPLAEAYEPGSVMKPFVVSRAMDLQRATPDEMINTEGGKFRIAGRDVVDEHKAPFMSLRNVMRWSSNIGAIKVAMRLSEREEYEALRDFGFGTYSGLPYPAESRGRLEAPKWHPQVQSSMAMGYGMMATPLQIAAAYVSIANGGELLQPALIREIRDPDGRVVFAHSRTVLRRVMEPGTAATMRVMLESVVDSGTAVAADLATYDVAGKSGTARRKAEGQKGYGRLLYNSTFAGMFPAQAPQYVLVVRLVDPQGKIFGGTVAGGVVNTILQDALATRDASFDRRALAAVAKPLPTKPAKPLSPKAMLAAARDTARFDSLRAPAPPPAPAVVAPSRVIVALPLRASSARDDAPAAGRSNALTDKRRAIAVTATDARGDSNRHEPRAVPSVYGLNVREAVRALQMSGFNVSIAYTGTARTRPAAGTMLRGGATVVLEASR